MNLSKNNVKERLEKEAQHQVPHYGLRKLSIGVASVLLSTTLYWGVGTAQANADTTATDATVTVTTSAATSTSAASQESAATSTAASATSDATSSATTSSATATSTTTSDATTTATTSDASSASEAAASATTDAVVLAASANVTSDATSATSASSDSTSTSSDSATSSSAASENQAAANASGLTSSDNGASNIYLGSDGSTYYKVITEGDIQYVYQAADIRANGTAFGQTATNAENTDNNLQITKVDLGNGKTQWTVVFFPSQVVKWTADDTGKGLVNMMAGFALTKDYTIDGDITVTINSRKSAYVNDYNPRFMPETTVTQSFNPTTDVDSTGKINSSTWTKDNNRLPRKLKS